MAGKPELSAAPGVQNVVVYVSNDNFAQAYAVNHAAATATGQPHHAGSDGMSQQQPPQQQQQHQQQHHSQNGHAFSQTQVVLPKMYTEKQQQQQNQLLLQQHQQHLLGMQHQQAQQTFTQPPVSGGYFTNHQAVITHPNGGAFPPFNAKTKSAYVEDVTARTKDDYHHQQQQQQHHQQQQQQVEAVVPPTGYVLMGGENASRSCDSVRSEAAESSCSSVSDDGMLILPNNLMQVYDHQQQHQPQHAVDASATSGASAVNVRHGVVVAVGGAPHAPVSGAPLPPPAMMTTVPIPVGWKRLISNGVVIYVSPSNTALSSLDQIKAYLLTPSTCKCGLECPLKCDTVFNFDPKVVGKAWTFTPDANNGDLTKLCNHKRKFIEQLKECNQLAIKKKKRKVCGSPFAPNVQIPHAQQQLHPQRIEKLGVNSQQLQVLQQQSQQHQNLQQAHAMPPQIQHHQPPQQFITKDIFHHQPPASSPQAQSHSQQEVQQQIQAGNTSPQILGQRTFPGYQIQPHVQQGVGQHHIIGYQSPQPQPQQIAPPQQGQLPGPAEQRLNSPIVLGEQIVIPTASGNQNISSHGMQIQAGTQQQQQPQPQHQQQLQQQDQQQQMRPHIIGSNGQVLIPAGNILTSSGQRVLINGQPSEPSGPGRPMQMIPVSITSTGASQSSIRSDKLPTGFIQANGQIYQTHQGLRPLIPTGIRQQYGGLIQQQQHQQPPQPHKVWTRMPNTIVQPQQQQQQPQIITPNAYERVPPLHQHQPPQLTQVQVQVWPEESSRKKLKNKVKKRYVETSIDGTRTININENNVVVSSPFPTENSSPSFMDDPSGYLAQQTALLNSTINRQTGVNNFVCNSPQPPHQQPMQPNQNQQQQQQHSIPLPSNMKSYRQQPQLISVKVNSYNPPADSALDPNCPQQCVVECHDSPGPVISEPIRKYPRSANSSQPGTPDPVTSTNYPEKHSPDSRPIQGGTVSTSNVSPVAIEIEDSGTSASTSPAQDTFYMESQPSFPATRTVVTTMASGRTVGSNTITSVLAGRANTATVSITNPPNAPNVSQIATRSPLEMVQSVVSSIKLPQSQSGNPTISLQNLPQQMMSKSLPPGHILVSSGGQLLMATTNASQSNQHMPPPPPKLQTSSMPPISVSPMITNVTASVTQMIPAVAQQVLGQQTVLVNALPGPFVLQPGVTMTMDGMNQLQLQPQLVAGNVIQQQLQPNLLSPENKSANKKGKKRKMPTAPTVASMLQIAAAQNSQASTVVGFPQQIQMHSPQGLTATPVMQALTIVPGKAGSAPQFVMNGQMPNAQIINSQSQPINLLQPVNLAQGMVQNFPTIQQIVLPTNLAGMVMNADGTATIVQDTSNLGMQLQLQNVNGQNVLTPVQNNQMFTATVGANGQSIIPGGMVIRPQGKIIQQQHSPGAQFLSPTGGGQFVAQFNGQLSPLVASVSPGQQVTFSPQIRPTTVQQPVQQQEFIQCGQTLMVPANLAAVSQTANSQHSHHPQQHHHHHQQQQQQHHQQNATYVQQNTTIVQQQTTMMSNQNNTNPPSNINQHNMRQGMHNIEQGYVLTEKQPPTQHQQQNIHAVVVQQRQSPLQPQQLHQAQQQQQINYCSSVSTQTLVNGHTQNVATFCQTTTSNNRSAGSPPDTTTLSPMASGGQSPPTADTTTHSGSTDDGLSPAPSNCSDVVRHSSMAMVHCVSSSEPDTIELPTQNQDFDWRNASKMEFTDINTLGNITQLKKTIPTRVEYAESSTLMYHHAPDAMHKHYEKPKRKHSDTLIVMETRHAHPFFDVDDDDEGPEKAPNGTFVEGDLVWGPAKGCPAWPGKLLRVQQDIATVRWFGGGEKSVSDVSIAVLQTLSEGLDAHHRASKKSRTGRKLNPQLEKAIQEAMAELDKIDNSEQAEVAYLKSAQNEDSSDVSVKKEEKRKASGRLRSSRQ